MLFILNCVALRSATSDQKLNVPASPSQSPAKSSSAPTPNDLAAIRRAFEDAAVRFIPAGNSGGRGVVEGRGMVTRQQRLNDFESDGQPPAGELMELLCEDHNGTYVLPFPCRWVDGAWRSIRSDHQIDANVIGWRRQ